MKKGFTLIEIVGVIIVLGIIALIAILAINRTMGQNREDLYAFQIKSIEEGARNWIMQNVGEAPEEGRGRILTLGFLQDNGFVKEDIENPLTREPFPRNLIVCVRRRNGALIYSVGDNIADCGPPTCESCFVFDSATGTITWYKEGTDGCPVYVIIPRTINGVTVINIGPGAFEGSGIIEVVIPNTVVEIGHGAFVSTGLTNVTIPNSVTTIGEYAFPGLSEVTIPNSVTTIGPRAFSPGNLTNVTIPNSVTTIGGGAFNDNQLPDNQALIFARNADGTEDRTTIVSYGGANRNNVVIPNSVTTIGRYAFLDNRLTNVTIPNSVTIIGDFAFLGNRLTNLSISNNVTTIGESAFGSNRLTNVTIPNNVISIGNWAFSGNQLTSITIPNNITTIGDGVFSSNRLTNVTIPNSVTTIGAVAFHGNLLTNVNIGTGVTSIGQNAFNKTSLWNPSNPELTTIINRTGRSFNWRAITGSTSPGTFTFVTGTVTHPDGNITVSAN